MPRSNGGSGGALPLAASTVSTPCMTVSVSTTTAVLNPISCRTGGAHGDPNIFFHMGYWRLADDEALLVDLLPPRCEYWNFQLNNHWMESLDYRHHTIHLNAHTARADADGAVRLVVAHRDPGLPNWIDTAGHARGTMGLRWVKADAHPTPSCRVVKHAALAARRP